MSADPVAAPTPSAAAICRSLVGVDLGLRTGIAVYGPTGGGAGPVRLLRYTSAHLGSRTSLRRAAQGILAEAGPVSEVVMEGDRALARIWERNAVRQGATASIVPPERWREALLIPRDRRTAPAAKRAADRLAHEVIAWSRATPGAEGPPRPTGPLRHDAADAIMVGLWGVVRHGWVGPEELPFPLPR